MENAIIMTESKKRFLGLISFLPFLAWCVWCLYIMILTKPLIDTETFQNHEKIVTYLAQHFTTVTILMGIAVLVNAIVLFYYVIHLARIKTMNGSSKAGWIVFMIAFGALAIPIFWYMEILHEPEYIATHASIA